MINSVKRAQLNVLLDGENIDVWHILTALRGPDLGKCSTQVKSATTAVIRYAVGLKVCNSMAMSNPDSDIHVEVRKSLSTLGDKSEYWHSHHFYAHAVEAFKSLGLKWDEVNK